MRLIGLFLVGLLMMAAPAFAAPGELALKGAVLLNPESLEEVDTPLSGVPLLVSITAENVGFDALPSTGVNVTDGGSAASGTIPALAAGARVTVQIPFTFSSTGCRELSIQAELTGQATQRQLLVPVGDVNACSSSGIDVTATLETRPAAGQDLVAGTPILISGTADYTGYSTPPLGAVVTVELIQGNLVYPYTTYTRSPDGSWAIGDGYLPEKDGDYTLKVSVSDGQLRGSTSQTVAVVAGSGPNLRGKDLSFAGEELYLLGNKKYAPTDAAVQLSVMLQNAGVAAATGNVKVRFYLDEPDPTPDTLLCEKSVSINLAGVTFSGDFPNYSYQGVSCSTPWTPTAAGVKNVYALIDTDNAIAESQEDDNQISSYIGIRARKPDLRPYLGGYVPAAKFNPYLVFSHEPGVGETVTISADIYNVGTDDLPLSGFNVKFYDGDPASGGILIDTARVSDSILTGEKAVATVNWAATGAAPGYHDIWVVVDADDEIDEDFESENRAAGKLDVLDTNANLQVLQVFLGNYPVVNQPNALYAELKNRSILAAPNTQIGFYQGDPVAGGTLLGTVQSGAIARGGKTSVTLPWTPTAIGTAYLYARVEPSGHRNYTARTVNPTPKPDIKVVASDITISGNDSTRQLGSSATVSANISEINGASAGTFSVRFTTEDFQDLGTRRISLGAWASALVTAPLPMTFKYRQHLVRVETNPEEDADFGNNVATKAAKANGGYPIASAGDDRSAFTGDMVTLGTTESVGPYFQWVFIQMPSGSSAPLNNATSRQAWFRPDTHGNYVAQLTATNGTETVYDSVTIHVDLRPTPTPNVFVPSSSNNGDFKISWGNTVGGATYFVEEKIGTGSYSPIYSGTIPYLYLYGKAAGTYTYRVRTTAPGYADGDWGVSGPCAVTLTLAAPSNIYVPATSDTGNYKISFGASNVTGVTYVLEESPNGSGFTQVYSGTVSYAYINGRIGGSYVYRVKATKTSAGFAESAWTTSAPCVVAGGAGNQLKLKAPSYISVPLTSATGNISIFFGSSSVSGVTYIVQESFDGGGSWNPTPVYTGTISYKYLYNLPSKTYTYRVKAIKSGYDDSDWTVSGGCNVSLALTAPKYINVYTYPNYIRVSYGPSNVTGVTYHLEERKDGGTWQPVYDGPISYSYLSGRTTGSYEYRVMVTKADFASSTYTASGSYSIP